MSDERFEGWIDSHSEQCEGSVRYTAWKTIEIHEEFTTDAMLVPGGMLVRTATGKGDTAESVSMVFVPEPNGEW